MEKCKYFGLIAVMFLLFGQTPTVSARDYVSAWYIKEMKTEININDDGSIDVDEKIAADCGSLPDKHGIFRTLPTLKYLTDTEVIKQTVTLQSLTDFSGNKLKYSESVDNVNDTLTWKIGEASKTVTGVNNYEIKYNVANVILGNSETFDEFYWNVHGQFWDMEADQVEVVVNFPETFDYTNQETNLYGGLFGGNDSIANYKWLDKNTVEIKSTRTLGINEGLTLSVTMPKGMTATGAVQKLDEVKIPYKLPWFWIWLLIIFQVIWILLIPITLIYAGYIWYKYGRDPVVNKTIIAQYEPPSNLNPMQLGVLINNGELNSKYITASIVNMAVKKFLTIKEIPKKGWFGSKDYQLDSLKDSNLVEFEKLSHSEKDLFNDLFGNSKSVKISSLKDKFYTHIEPLKTQVVKELTDDFQMYEKKGFDWKFIMFIVGILSIFLPMFLIAFFPILALSSIVSGIILIIFSYWMPKHTVKGAEEQWKAKGFKLFMETAEKYRQKFYEDENIFERYLPYAIVFNIVQKWAKNMENIYGKEKMQTYSPYWYTNSLMGAGFDVDAFTSNLTAMSSQMSSSISSSPSSSGSGGGGFSGGGGGGGGGGGW
jgi:uncharacterized membrane protein